MFCCPVGLKAGNSLLIFTNFIFSHENTGSDFSLPARRRYKYQARIKIIVMREIILKPIGFVKNNVKKPRFGGFANEISEIVVNKKFAGALQGIDDYSHVIIIYWMDRIKDYAITHRPQGNPEVPVVGIFACRCPQRPNPIAITTVKLISRKGNRIKVKGLDVLNGTPVIDIKPYWPQYDRVKNEKIPKWVNKLEF